MDKYLFDRQRGDHNAPMTRFATYTQEELASDWPEIACVFDTVLADEVTFFESNVRFIFKRVKEPR